MNSTAGFVLKLSIASTALSVLIKYGGPALAISATPTNAAIAVFLPSIVMAIVLWLRSQQLKSF